jgi:hypothetical protein
MYVCVLLFLAVFNFENLSEEEILISPLDVPFTKCPVECKKEETKKEWGREQLISYYMTHFMTVKLLFYPLIK